MNPIFENPKFHIVSLGILIALFLFIVLGPVTPSKEDRKIVVDDADVVQLIASWRGTWNRMPTKEELTGILQNHVREEVLYEEALKQGLDKTNAAVKRALITQMDMLAEGQGEETKITDEDILAYYNLRKDQFFSPARLSFKQIYFRQEGDSESLSELRETWNKNGSGFEQVRSAGAATMLPPFMQARTPKQIDREFGEGFSDKIEGMQPGLWQGPVASTFGWHLIYPDTLIPSAPLPVSAVQSDIYEQLQYEEKNAAKEQFYTELIQQYDITYRGVAKQIVNE